MNKSQKVKGKGPMKARGNSKKAQTGQVPAAYTKVVVSREPRIKASSRSSRVQHRELISSILGSTSLAVTRFQCNPGLSGTFPWLSAQASAWEQYRFHKLKFEYITRIGTTSAGSVIYSPEYDPSDLTPTTEQQLTNTRDAIEGPVYRGFECPLDPAAMHAIGPRKFVRSGNVPGDIKTFDVAAFFLGTIGEADTTEIGKLYVDYDVEFFVPQDSPNKDTGPSSMTVYKLGSDQTLLTGAAEIVEFDTVVYDPLNIGSPTAGVFTPPAGSYLVEVVLGVADAAAESFSANLTVRKNGATLSNVIQSYIALDNGASAPNIQIIAKGIVPLNGSDTVDAYLQLIGAAGALKADSPFCQIFFSPV